MDNEKLLSAIADQVPGLVVLYNINNGQYLYVNKAVKKILGHAPEDFINGGVPFAVSLVHPDDLAPTMQKNAAALATANANPQASADEDPIVSFEYRMQHKDGSWRWLQTEGTVFNRSASGQVELVLNVSIDITARKLAEEQLMIQQQKLELGQQTTAVLESMPQKIFTAQPDGNIDYFNPQWLDFTGLSFEQIRDWGWAQFIHPEDIEENIRVWKHSLETGEPFQFENRFRRADGEYRWHLSRAVPMRDAQGKIAMWIGSNTDIHEQKLVQERLRINEERFRSLIEAVEDYAIFGLNAEGFITSWNEGAEKILGYEADEIIGKHLHVIYTEDDKKNKVAEASLEQTKNGGATVREGLRVRKDGSIFHAVVTTTAIRDEKGNIKGFSKILRDVTEKKEAEETIRYQAFHDPLTGLANRKALDQRFADAQALAQQNKDKLALLFLDLDRFKVINDTLGHGVGDMILREVADRLLRSVRKHDTVARLGGDEFILLLNDVRNIQDVMKVAQKIISSFEDVIRVQDQSLHTSASIGIAMSPGDGEDMSTLLKNADTALYRAKDAGRNRYQFYNYSMNLQSAARLSLEQDLRHAVSRNELEMFYQPFADIRTGKILGVESLLRWNHPKLGMLCPGDFIPVAEETGLIIPIGYWILETVCKQGKLWRERGLQMQMTVNLSARQFGEQKIVDMIVKTLQQTGFDARGLELEITESVAMENIARTSSKLTELKQLGIGIAIDDFGTGYSSLSYLKRFPVHKLKIDKSFIKHAISNTQDAAIVQAIISMSKSLGLKVCAEGVEDMEQMRWLAQIGCDIVQGFYICKPIAAEEFEARLKEGMRL